MEQFTLGNVIFPISYKQAKRIMTKFEACACEVLGDAKVEIATYAADYLTAEEGSGASFQRVMLDPTNQKNHLSLLEHIEDMRHEDWQKARYLRMTVASTTLSNCFMRAHFKGTQNKMVSFDVKGCGSGELYNHLRVGFMVEGHRSMRNTCAIRDYDPKVHGL